MTEEDRGRTIGRLASRVGVSLRTIRYYISSALLPGPGTRGKGEAYGEDHLLRLTKTVSAELPDLEGLAPGTRTTP